MNSRERLRRCYCHEQLDRPGVYSRTGFPANDPTYDRLKAYLAEHTELKRGWSGVALEPQYKLTHRTEPYSQAFARQVATMHTPAGEFQATRFVSLEGKPGMVESCFIKTRGDAERYLSLPLPKPVGDTASFWEAEKAIGDRGIVDVSLGLNPAGSVAELLGSETFALMSVTDRDITHALCEREMQMALSRLKFLLAQGIGPFFSMLGEEYVVPPLHSPTDFADFNVQYDAPIVDLIHNAGARIHIHCHGAVRAVFGGFLAMGVDVLHPLEPPPMGDITAAEAKELAGEQLCIEGNIQIGDMYDCTPQQVREQTEALIAAAFADRRNLIVSPSASPFIRGAGERCFAQYKAMIDTVLAWRG